VNRIALSAVLATLSITLAVPAWGQPSLQGYFIALSECAANKKKDSDNPGNVHLQLMHAYEMLARNATPGTHYQVKVPGAPVTESRWVPMSCGAYAPKNSLVVAGGGGSNGGGGGPQPGPSGLQPDSIEFVLAASWQPAFCQSSAGQDKLECTSQTPDRFDATHFSLHGLWPDDLDNKAIFPCYCERGAPVSCGGSQARDTNINLSQAVRDKLAVAMPGTQSGLELHEWPKHGSCYEDDKTADTGADPDEYFTDTMALMEALNDSDVQDLFESHIGQSLTRAEIEAAFNDAFGDGAAARVIIKCNGSGANRVISELWIGLKGDITPASDFAELIQAAPPTSSSTDNTSCAGGKVVEVN
jgi:ribonuclease T2